MPTTTDALVAVAVVIGVVLASTAPVVWAEDRCTAILVGPKASSNGAPMTTHTADCSSCDFRLAKVPAQSHPRDARQEIELVKLGYPRHVGDDRGEVYRAVHLDARFFNWTPTPSMGSIPQVPETLGYLDGVYGILNEHQLAFGESTCGARFVSRPRGHGGEALLDIAALSRLAMQRTTTARGAIELMGALAVEHGYYGAAWEGAGASGEAGEALTIADPREAWVFHILPDDTGRSAIWAAQRLPDDHVAVVANEFIIHGLDLADPASFMASANIHDVAIRQGLWRPEDARPFDFAAIYGPPEPNGAYSNRRVWRVLSLVNPTVPLSPEAPAYPFSVQSTRVLTPHDLMTMHRDHYEGTVFDMTQGPAAGPFGDPDRYDPSASNAANGLTPEDLHRGHFERAISIFRASYSFVAVLDPRDRAHALLWFGQYAPHATVYTPVFAHVDATPVVYHNSSLRAFDWRSAFWVNALVGNWAARVYRHAHPQVLQTQIRLEAAAERAVTRIRTEAAGIRQEQGEAALREYLTRQSTVLAETGVAVFTELFEALVTRFHDGYEVMTTTTIDGVTALQVRSLFYPRWWLELVGFFTSTGRPPATRDDCGSSVQEAILVVTGTGALGLALGRATRAWSAPRGVIVQ